MLLTVAYVTHDQAEALAVSDQIIVMDAGHIAQIGSPQALYAHPATEFVAGFMGEAVLLPGRASSDGSIALGPLRVESRQAVASGPVKVAMRPEAWRVLPPDTAGLAGTVLKHAYLGSFQELTVDTELGLIFVVSTDVGRLWRAGEGVMLQLPVHGVSVVDGRAI